jgi:hypothetical protein
MTAAEDKAAKAAEAEAARLAEQEAAAAATPEEVLVGVTSGLPDGPVTFSRPGIETRDFTVKDGKISTTKEGQDWLLRNVVGVVPAAD